MTRNPSKITHRTWALLQSGHIASIHDGASSLRCERKVFVMRGPRGEHFLDTLQTDAERLSEHWRQFVIANREPRTA